MKFTGNIAHSIFVTSSRMNLTELGIVPIFHVNRRRLGGYVHKEQVSFYSINGEEGRPSDAFRKRYRFREQTVEGLVQMLGDEIAPIANTNNAFTSIQKLCIALRFFATGTHQTEVGDGEGASQSSVCHIVKQVSTVLSNHANDVIKFSLDDEVLNRVSTGFYGFKASK